MSNTTFKQYSTFACPKLQSLLTFLLIDFIACTFLCYFSLSTEDRTLQDILSRSTPTPLAHVYLHHLLQLYHYDVSSAGNPRILTWHRNETRSLAIVDLIQGKAPMNRLVSLPWRLWAFRSFRRFTLPYRSMETLEGESRTHLYRLDLVESRGECEGRHSLVLWVDVCRKLLVRVDSRLKGLSKLQTSLWQLPQTEIRINLKPVTHWWLWLSSAPVRTRKSRVSVRVQNLDVGPILAEKSIP